MTGPGCGWSKISRVRAPYDNLGPAVKPLQSPESAVYIMDSLLEKKTIPSGKCYLDLNGASSGAVPNPLETRIASMPLSGSFPEYWIMGRVDDVLNVAGHHLSTMEIESALVSHPAVAEAAVVGKPD